MDINFPDTLPVIFSKVLSDQPKQTFPPPAGMQVPSILTAKKVILESKGRTYSTCINFIPVLKMMNFSEEIIVFLRGALTCQIAWHL